MNSVTSALFPTIAIAYMYIIQMSIFSDTCYIQGTKLSRDVLNHQLQKMKFHCRGTEIFLKIYFDAAYVFCLCPYRLRRDKPGSRTTYIRASWWPQKVLCAAFTFSGIPWFFLFFRMFLTTSTTKDASTYFKIVGTLLDTFLKLVTLKQFWMNGSSVVEIVNKVAGQEKKRPRNNEIYIKIVTFALIFVYVGVSVYFWANSAPNPPFKATRHVSIADTDEYNPPGGWSANGWWISMIETGKFNFFIERKNATTNLDEGNFQVEILLGIFTAVGFLQKQLIGTFTDLFLLVSGLTFHFSVKQFRSELPKVASMHADYNQVGSTKTIQPENLPTWIDIYQQFKSIKRLSRMINQYLGTNVTCFISTAILFFATSLDDIVTERQKSIMLIRVIFIYCNYGAILIVAADINHQIQQTEDCLTLYKEPGNAISIEDMFCAGVLRSELEKKVVAIRGSNVFPITYSHLANVSHSRA